MKREVSEEERDEDTGHRGFRTSNRSFCFHLPSFPLAAHMSEETNDAQSSAPWSIVNTCLAGSVTGFVYLLGLLYAALNVDLVLNGASSQTVVNIYTQAFTSTVSTDGWNPADPATCLNPTCCDASNPACTLVGPVRYAGATALTVLLIINIFFAGFSSMTVTSRIGFAMVRDGAMPGSGFLYSVEPRTKAPVRMIVLVFLLDALLCCLPLGSSTAFAAITGITTVGYQISYAIPIFLRLTASRETFVQTPAFHLGRYSLVVGWISCIWLAVTSCLFFFPTQFNAEMAQTAESFNYTCVVVGGTMILALTYWFLPRSLGGARWHFVGPKRKDEGVTGGKGEERGEKVRMDGVYQKMHGEE
jgi:amino acid transporter